MNMKHKAKAALLALGLSMAISGAASAQRSSGFLADFVCQAGLVSDTARMLGTPHDAVSNKINRDWAKRLAVSQAQNCEVPASQQPQMTTRCYFQTGMMAGRVFDFAGMAAPMPVGGLCNDGMGGLGVSVQ